MRNGLSKQAAGPIHGTTGTKTHFCVYSRSGTNSYAHERFAVFTRTETIREPERDWERCVCVHMLIWGKIRALWSCTGWTTHTHTHAHTHTHTHTVVRFMKPHFCQSKHLQRDFGLKFSCCCQPERFTPKIRLAVNAPLGSQWKQMHVYALQILK